MIYKRSVFSIDTEKLSELLSVISRASTRSAEEFIQSSLSFLLKRVGERLEAKVPSERKLFNLLLLLGMSNKLRIRPAAIKWGKEYRRKMGSSYRVTSGKRRVKYRDKGSLNFLKGVVSPEVRGEIGLRLRARHSVRFPFFEGAYLSNYKKMGENEVYRTRDLFDSTGVERSYMRSNDFRDVIVSFTKRKAQAVIRLRRDPSSGTSGFNDTENIALINSGVKSYFYDRFKWYSQKLSKDLSDVIMS